MSSLGNYVPFVLAGDFLFLSGQIPRDERGVLLTGKVGENVSVEEAYQHARRVGTQMLSVVESALGSLDRVQRVVKIVGFINSGASFREHPKVLNGCSDVLVEVLGDAGRHARSVLGVSSLPENLTLEIEAVFQVRASHPP